MCVCVCATGESDESCQTTGDGSEKPEEEEEEEEEGRVVGGMRMNQEERRKPIDEQKRAVFVYYVLAPCLCRVKKPQKALS